MAWTWSLGSELELSGNPYYTPINLRKSATPPVTNVTNSGLPPLLLALTFLTFVIVLTTLLVLRMGGEGAVSQKQLTPYLPTLSTSQSPMPTADKRRVFTGTWADIEFLLSKGETSQLNMDTPVTHISYSNSAFGVKEVKLPYNPHWGTPSMAVRPDNESLELKRVSFGPLVYFEGTFDRAFRLQVISYRSVNELKAKYQIPNEANFVTSKSRHEYQVVRYQSTQDDFYRCDPSLTEVIGKSRNYLFVPPCAKTYAPSQEVIDRVVDSLVLN